MAMPALWSPDGRDTVIWRCVWPGWRWAGVDFVGQFLDLPPSGCGAR